MQPAIHQQLRKITYASFIVYCLAVLYGISFHEPWRDEAQSWLVVKNLDFIGVLQKLPSEGHPPLWYLIIFPFAKLGLPYAVQNWLSAIIMIGAVYLFQFKTSLNPYIKILLPFSYLFLFEYAIIARNYCVTTLFVALLLWMYPRRFEKPWLYALCVVGLFNTHMLIFTFCATVTGLFLLEAIQMKKLNSRTIGSTVLMAVGGLYLIPYIVMTDVKSVFEPFVTDHGQHMMQAIGNGLLASADMQNIALLFLIIICISFLNNYKLLLLLMGGISGVLYILGYEFAGDIRHAGIMFLVLIFVYGVAPYYKQEAKSGSPAVLSKYSPWVFLLLVALQVPAAIKYFFNDKDYVYSDSKNAAEFLKGNKLDHAILTGHFAWAASAILPYLDDGQTMYYVECQRQGSYYVFDSCFVNQSWNRPAGEYIQTIYRQYQNELGKVVMIFNYPLQPDIAKWLDLIYQPAEKTIREDEMYYMYKFRLSVNSPQQQ